MFNYFDTNGYIATDVVYQLICACKGGRITARRLD